MKFPKSLIEDLHKWGCMKQTGVSLRYMMEFGSTPTEKNLLISAQFLHKELPIRVARRAIELETLPYGLSEKPAVLKVRSRVLVSFSNRVSGSNRIVWSLNCVTLVYSGLRLDSCEYCNSVRSNFKSNRLQIVMKLFNEWNKMVRTNPIIVGFKLEIYNKLKFNMVSDQSQNRNIVPMIVNVERSLPIGLNLIRYKINCGVIILTFTVLLMLQKVVSVCATVKGNP